MKRIHFDVESDGFYGAYWQNKTQTSKAIIAMLGDDSEDYMAKSCVNIGVLAGIGLLLAGINTPIIGT